MPQPAQSALRRAWTAGCARWPDLDLSYETFAAHVEDLRSSRSSPSDEELAAHAEDLFLVAACLAGAPTALGAIDRAVLSQVPDMVAVVDPSYGFGAEVAQMLRERLLCPPLERLRQYGGSGPLAAWVRVAARRLAVDIKRREGASIRQAAQLPAAMASHHPEWELLRRRYQVPLETALRAALENLPARDRMVLRLYLLRGENIEGIGRIYGVHRATVARWIAAAQRSIADAVLQRLKGELGLSPSEFESLARELGSKLEITLSSVL
jgi:RNA polymerase sigma-70 factor (ECF subfamily)